MPADRGRLVMLVDNGVNGDSRVQKAARSAAAAGWEVVLLGRSPGRSPQVWELGGAQVRLLPVPTPLGRQRHELRRAPLRRPLAYPPGPTAGRRQQQMKAWRADLRVRRAALRHPAPSRQRSAAARLAESVRLVPLRLVARAADRWVRLRARQTRSLENARKRMDGTLDLFTTAFWQRTMGQRAWRRLDPGLWDYELAYAREVDALQPDLIHANDFRMLGVGARAKLRAREEGRDVRLVWDVHEYLPGIKPWNDHPRWHPAQCAHEEEYAPYADAVVTVSETLADMLVERHGLPERPAVVLNAPDLTLTPADDEFVPDLREQCGIGPSTPLLVYSGAAAPQRGLDLMVEALPALSDVHVALVVLKPTASYVQGLLRRAEELGVADRLHAMGYVPHHQVVPFLSTADAGVIPIHHWPNHEIALITKFFEYSHARLPLVISDVKTMGETTTATGQGEVFTAEDLEDYVRAVKAVLSDPRRYRRAYDRPGLLQDWTWEGQAARLDDVYARLSEDLALGYPAARRSSQEDA